MAAYTEEERERSLARLTQELQDVKAEAAQVARLEADKAALAAAVDKAAGLLGEEYLRTRNLIVGSVAVGLRAALSDHAGTGWLPPEAREQVREALKQAECELYGIEPVKPYRTIVQVQAACAALDALKGVE